MSNQAALLASIKLLVDGAKDLKASLAPGQSLLQKIEAFGNLLPDIEAEFENYADFSAEIKALQPSDIPALASVAVADWGIQDAKAQAIVTAALKVLGDFAQIEPDIAALVQAIEAPAPAATAPSTPAPASG